LVDLATKPTRDVREFTDDTCWAQQPVTRIYYVEEDTGNLCSINSDGQGRRVLIPDVVRDYQFRADEGWFLYRNGSDRVCFLRQGGKPQVCWQTDRQFAMDQVACNPGGTVIAYLSRDTEDGSYELVLYDIDAGRTVRTGVMWAGSKDEWHDVTEIAWSNTSSQLLLRHDDHLEAFQIGANLAAVPVPVESCDSQVSVVYGRFREGSYSWGPGHGPWYGRDVCGRREVVVSDGVWFCRLAVTTEDGSRFVLADNPGIIPVSTHWVFDVFFISDGNELVICDDRDIYLLDVNQRKLGWLVHGTKPIIAAEKFQRKMPREKETVPADLTDP